MSLSKDSATSELALFIGMNLGFHTFFDSLKFYPLFFDDLSVAIVLSKFIEKPSIHCVGVCTHKLAVAERDLLGGLVFNKGRIPHKLKEVIRVQLSRAVYCSY